MSLTMEKGLQDILDGCFIIDLNKLFDKVLKFAREKLTCREGAAYLFDRATNRLKLKATTWESVKSGDRPFSLLPGQGIEGTCYSTGNFCDLNMLDPLCEFVYPPYLEIEEIHQAVALPVHASSQVTAVLCFYYDVPGSGGDEEKQRRKIDILQDELKKSKLGTAIQRIQAHSIPGKIHQAGQSTARLTTEVSHYISKLQDILNKKPWGKPDIIYVQIKDVSRNLIQTVQGVCDHQKLQISSSHPLIPENGEQEDINSYIIRKRCVEIISGLDPRFDKKIYDAYGHRNYTRMWIPLFPFPQGGNPGKNAPKIRERVEAMIKFEDKSQDGLARLVGHWREEDRPPEELVYGVLEIGYRMDKPENPSIAPWTKDHAKDVIAVAYEYSIALFRTTIPGVMERIGRMLSHIPFPCGVEFDYLFPNKDKGEHRNYPIDSQWPVAVPQTLANWGERPPCKPNQFEPDLRKRPVSIRFSFNQRPKDPEKEICVQNSKAAEEAVETAFKLYEAVMAPIMLMERNNVQENVGTLVDDEIIKEMMEGAAKLNGALYAAFFAFETSSKTGELISAPPVEWRTETYLALKQKEIERNARQVAEIQSPLYLSEEFSSPICFLPLRLKNGSIGVVTLIFKTGLKFNSARKMDLERQLLLWNHSIVLHQLILRIRFSNLLMQSRKTVFDIREKVLNEPIPIDPTIVFIKKLLYVATERLMIKASLFSLNTKSKTGPQRLSFYWSQKLKEVRHIEFSNINMSLNNKLLIGRYQVDIISGKDLEHCRRDVIHFLNGVNAYRTRNREQQKECEKLLKLCRDEKIKAVLVLPIHKENYGISLGNTEPVNDIEGWVYLFFTDVHFLKEVHKQLINELGHLVGRTLAKIKKRKAEKESISLSHKADMRIKAFESASSIDEVIKTFLKGLGTWSHDKIGNGLREEDYFNISNHAVIWTYSRESKKLVARSGRGNALDAIILDTIMKDIIDLEEHPVFSTIPIPKDDEYPRLSSSIKFKFSTYDLTANSKPKFQRLFKIYREKTGQKWMISFPMVDASDKIFGVFDLLCESPLPEETESVWEDEFCRISKRLNSVSEKVRHRKVRRITERLFIKATVGIEQANTFQVYNELATILKDTFNCEQCDIFVERHGKYFLFGSTHENAPQNQRHRALHWFEKGSTSKVKNEETEVFDWALKNKYPCIVHEWDKKIVPPYFSPSLIKFLGSVNRGERLIFPLRPMNGNQSNHIDGLVQLHAPKQLTIGGEGGKIKKNQRFSAEDALLARDVGLQFRRIIRMLQLAEQQIWLVNETVHSIAQPLQVMRSDNHYLIRHLLKTDLDRTEIRTLHHEMKQSYELTHETLKQLSYFAGIKQDGGVYVLGNLKKLVEECCIVMVRPAKERGLRIDYGGVKDIKPVPLEVSWLRKAILNLIENACKYSWNAQEIKVFMEETNGDIKIKVVNWGIGIPSNDMDKIYNAYFRSRIDDSHGKRTGTGIGLSIVKNAVETFHLGKVRVQSIPVGKKDGVPFERADQIRNKLHETRFEVILNRQTLNSLLQEKKNE